MQQNLIDKIYCELDMIRITSQMSNLALQNELKNIRANSFELIFQDIEKRCWQISEWVEQLQNT